MSAQQMTAGSDTYYSTPCLYHQEVLIYQSHMIEQQQARQTIDAQEQRTQKQWENIAHMQQMQKTNLEIITQERCQKQALEHRAHYAGHIPG